jgi:hypothetical protein
MLGSILKEEYSKNRGEDLKKFYDSAVVCGCLFQSFDDFSKNIILRFIANEGRLQKNQLSKLMNPNDPNALKELDEIFYKLEELSIIDYSKQ